MREHGMGVERVAYSLRDAASMFGISVKAVRLAVERGDIPHIKVGGKRYVTKEQLGAVLRGEYGRTWKRGVAQQPTDVGSLERTMGDVMQQREEGGEEGYKALTRDVEKALCGLGGG